MVVVHRGRLARGTGPRLAGAVRALPAGRPGRHRSDGRFHYRHFPNRADLIIAVYRHQVDACAEAGPALLASGATPHAALRQWIDLFVDFLVTEHGLAAALRSDDAGFDALHAYFIDRLVPVCSELLTTAADAGEIDSGIEAYELMRGVGNLCIGADSDPRYDARRLVGLLVTGLRRPR
ncbi:TetR family transcriptional regulator [Streptomyces violaceus]|uniref:TetR/AcrR family transcriptional regulator n=1 Tax=Streptomyces violaceus TaxID=1936 RepID=UPI002E1AFCCB